MPKYVCIAMLLDPPYNIVVKKTEIEPTEWIENLPLPSHLLCYGAFEDPDKIISGLFSKLESQGITPDPEKFFSALPFQVIISFISASNYKDIDNTGFSQAVDNNEVKKGPFGLSMGITLEQINEVHKQLSTEAYVVSVPNPHSAFDEYIVKISQTHGLYWIKAIGKTINTNSHGVGLQVEFNRFYEKLVSLYGSGKREEYLMPGSIWSEPQDYMMGLLKDEQNLYAVWDETNTAFSELGNNLANVFLMAKALDSNSGFIVLEYSFTNEKLAEKELALLEDSSL
jgi:hypothetical protein